MPHTHPNPVASSLCILSPNGSLERELGPTAIGMHRELAQIWGPGRDHLLQFKSEFSSKEFMIWATVSSCSRFCWQYRASSSSAAKNIIDLISVLTIWWCPRVESSLVLFEDDVCYDSAFSWQNSVKLCPASFYTPRPNLLVTPHYLLISYFAFQPPMTKKTSFWGISSRRSCRSS